MALPAVLAALNQVILNFYQKVKANFFRGSVHCSTMPYLWQCQLDLARFP